MTVSDILANKPAADDYSFRQTRYNAALKLHTKDQRYDEWQFITDLVGNKVLFAREAVRADGVKHYPGQVVVTRGGRIFDAFEYFRDWGVK